VKLLAIILLAVALAGCAKHVHILSVTSAYDGKPISGQCTDDYKSWWPAKIGSDGSIACLEADKP
jgi:hypothetical protein